MVIDPCGGALHAPDIGHAATYPYNLVGERQSAYCLTVFKEKTRGKTGCFTNNPEISSPRRSKVVPKQFHGLIQGRHR